MSSCALAVVTVDYNYTCVYAVLPSFAPKVTPIRFTIKGNALARGATMSSLDVL